MSSANPVLNQDTFRATYPRFGDQTQTMTIQGTIVKTFILLGIALISAGYTWSLYAKDPVNAGATLSIWAVGGAVVGLILAVITAFKAEWAPVTAPLYALAEGFFIGAISSIMEASFPGIVIQATTLTFGTLFAMLAAYQFGLVKATEKFKLGVLAATGGIAIIYVASMVLSLFGFNMGMIYGSGWTGILFSLFVVVVAALNFVIDFDFIEQGASRGAAKYMEWYGAFALMVTLVWLYVEFLRLLSKLRSRE